MRSQKTLLSFIAYAIAHPGERFWQAVRNWSGYGFVMVADYKDSRSPFGDAQHTDPIDTFNFERRRHNAD